MFKVLVVCTGNICRSPMAAGLLHHDLPKHLKPRVEVASAGTHALHGDQAAEHALAAMKEIGVDIHRHRARQITKEMARESDLILTMEVAHTSLVKHLIGWRQNMPRLISEFNTQTSAHDIQDPYGRPLQAYEACIQTLRPCIKGVILWLESTL